MFDVAAALGAVLVLPFAPGLPDFAQRRFRVTMAMVRQASLPRANLLFGIELIHRSHQ